MSCMNEIKRIELKYRKAGSFFNLNEQISGLEKLREKKEMGRDGKEKNP